MFFIDETSRDVRPPEEQQEEQNKFGGPSYSRILAHSFARTHDMYTNMKPKSISRLD